MVTQRPQTATTTIKETRKLKLQQGTLDHFLANVFAFIALLPERCQTWFLEYEFVRRFYKLYKIVRFLSVNGDCRDFDFVGTTHGDRSK